MKATFTVLAIVATAAATLVYTCKAEASPKVLDKTEHTGMCLGILDKLEAPQAKLRELKTKEITRAVQEMVGKNVLYANRYGTKEFIKYVEGKMQFGIGYGVAVVDIMAIQHPDAPERDVAEYLYGNNKCTATLFPEGSTDE